MLNSTFQSASWRKKIKTFLFVVLFLNVFPLLVLAGSYQAQHNSTKFKIEYEGLVPCGCVTTTPAAEAREIDETCDKDIVPGSATNKIYLHCQFCHFFVVFNNIVSFILTWIIPSLAVLMTVITGILFIISHISQTEILPPGEKGGPALLKKAKESFKSILIGLVIIYGSYLIIGLVLATFGVADGVAEWTTLNQWAKPGSSWFTISCPIELRPAPLPSPPVIGPIPTPSGGEEIPCSNNALCQSLNWKRLAECHNVPYPRKTDDRLTALINCVKEKIEEPHYVKGKKYSGGRLGSIFTFDNDYEICNYMRGENNWRNKCNTTCSHEQHFCHYGGTSGTTGALAVDFGYSALALPEWVKVNLKAYADQVRELICSEIPCKSEDREEINNFDDATLAKIALLNNLTSSCAWEIAKNLSVDDSKKYYPWRTPTSGLVAGDLGKLIEGNHLHVSFFCEGL